MKDCDRLCASQFQEVGCIVSFHTPSHDIFAVSSVVAQMTCNFLIRRGSVLRIRTRGDDLLQRIECEPVLHIVGRWPNRGPELRLQHCECALAPGLVMIRPFHPFFSCGDCRLSE